MAVDVGASPCPIECVKSLFEKSAHNGMCRSSAILQGGSTVSGLRLGVELSVPIRRVDAALAARLVWRSHGLTGWKVLFLGNPLDSFRFHTNPFLVG